MYLIDYSRKPETLKAIIERSRTHKHCTVIAMEHKWHTAPTSKDFSCTGKKMLGKSFAQTELS